MLNKYQEIMHNYKYPDIKVRCMLFLILTLINWFNTNYEDYTKHLDETRGQRFRNRNHRWKVAPKYSPAYLSYYKDDITMVIL